MCISDMGHYLATILDVHPTHQMVIIASKNFIL